MKVVVTGGAGFLGYHIGLRINEITNFSDSTFFDIAPFPEGDYNKEINCVYGDVRDAKQMDEMMKGADVVIHCAAALPLYSKKEIHTTDIDGTKNVLDCAKANGIKRVVMISSTAVYGIPDHHPLFEDDPLVGVGPYGEAKIAAEELCI